MFGVGRRDWDRQPIGKKRYAIILTHPWEYGPKENIEAGIRPIRNAGVDRNHEIVPRHDAEPLPCAPDAAITRSVVLALGGPPSSV